MARVFQTISFHAQPPDLPPNAGDLGRLITGTAGPLTAVSHRRNIDS